MKKRPVARKRAGKTTKGRTAPTNVRFSFKPLRRAFAAEEGGCNGTDCSRYKLRLFTTKTVVRTRPNPAPADQARVKLAADLLLQDKLTEMVDTLRALSQSGNLAGVVVMRFIRGIGGQEICDRYANGCECQPDMSNPAELWTSPPIDVSVAFNLGGIAYTVDYDCRCELAIARGSCHEPL